MYKFGILGTGKMGGAILDGVLRAKVFSPSDIVIFDLNKESLDFYKKKGVSTSSCAEDVFKESNIMLIALKPQNYSSLDIFSSIPSKGKTVISIAPGKKISMLENIFSDAIIVRAMPNTPALVGCATVTLFTKANPDDAALLYVKKIFSSIGKYEFLKSEKEIDLAIPLNGSMPAYLFSFVKEFVQNAILLGIDEPVAKNLCINSIIGSCKLLEDSKESIDTLINNVCSKGGTTIAGLDEMYKNGFQKAISGCYKACSDRSIELANS